MEIGVKRGKSSRRGIKLGICGEHGGDPKSVEFCHKIGLIMSVAHLSVFQLLD